MSLPEPQIDLAKITFPIEVHVFQHNQDFYCFDARNYAILKVNALSAAVLSRMATHTLDKIVVELSEQSPTSAIRATYVRCLQMIKDGTLSIEPMPRPSRPPFNHLVIMLAGGCNMGCTYCFEKDVPIYQKPNLMTKERADGVLQWFFKHQQGDTAHIQLYGGEPLLNWPILTHVVESVERWAEENRKKLTKYLITNGTLLNPERIRYLKDHDITTQVSVDGDAQTHDRFRIMKSGAATMSRIKPNIDELARQKVNYNLRAVLTRQNKDPDNVLSGLRSLGAEAVSFEVVATDNAFAQFTDSDWGEFNLKYKSLMDAKFADWDHVPDEVRSMILKICNGQHVFYGCGAGVSEVTIAPDGSIYECQRIYRTPYSNIAEGKGPVELNSQFLTMVDDRPICQDCWARYLCGGGCLQQSHVGHGKDDPLPQYCVMKRNLAEAAIVKIHEIRSRKLSTADLAGRRGAVCTCGD